MGLILNNISIDDFTNKTNIYSKQIRGKLDFFAEVHHLDNGKHLQIYLYRNHPDIKKFIDFNEGKNYLTLQKQEKNINASLLKLSINTDTFMIEGKGEGKIVIAEYNFNRDLADFAKGKVCVFMDFFFSEDVDNKRAVNEIRSLNMEETNEKPIITSN